MSLIFRRHTPLKTLYQDSVQVVTDVFQQHIADFGRSHRSFLRKHRNLQLPETEDHLSELVARCLNGLRRRVEERWLVECLAPLVGPVANVTGVFEVIGLAEASFRSQATRTEREQRGKELRQLADHHADADHRDEQRANDLLTEFGSHLSDRDRDGFLSQSHDRGLHQLEIAPLAAYLADQLAPKPGTRPAVLLEVPDAGHALALLRRINTQLHVDELRSARRPCASLDDGQFEAPRYLTPLSVIEALPESEASILRDCLQSDDRLDEIATRHRIPVRRVEDSMRRLAALVRIQRRRP